VPCIRFLSGEMRLAFAVSVLAKMIPVASSAGWFPQSNTDASGNTGHTLEQIKTFLAQRRALANSVDTEPKSEVSRRLKDLARKHQRPTQLSNSKLIPRSATLEAQTECHLLSTTADIGIFSCGSGRYCVESADSILGGVCVNATDDRDHRQIQEDTSTLIETIYSLCYGNASEVGDTCRCTGVSLEAYTGSVSCSYESYCSDLSNVCDMDATFCIETTYDLSVTGPYMGVGKTCYSITEPEVFQYCYNFITSGPDTEPTCAVEIDGTTCSACQLSQMSYSQDPTDCRIVDCSNTDSGISGLFCNYTVVEYNIANHLLFEGLPCPTGCNLCGPGGYITKPYFTFTLPTGINSTCRELDFNALVGYFESTDLCNTLPDIIAEPCGCTGGSAEESPEPFVCSICGESGDVTIPGAEVNIPTQGTFSCEAIQMHGQSGLISSVECPLVQTLVQVPCGCEGGAPLPNEPSDPTELPSAIAPTDPPASDGPASAQSSSNVVSTWSAIALIGLTTLPVVTSLFLPASWNDF
jgi:hypothetical protein